MKVLGNSEFNYADYTVWRFVHYYQQISHILKLEPKRVLEIGPGDYTVTDFLQRKGIYVKTFDNDKELFPDYTGDIRNPLEINEKFDLVLASEVLEHVDFKYVEKIIQNFYKVINVNGYLVISLPYSTVRIFPKRPDYGRVVSCEGLLYTFVPFAWVYPIYGLYRFLFKKENFKKSFIPFSQYEDDEKRLDVHRWDLGCQLNLKKRFRKIVSEYFKVEDEKVYINTNSIFYTLKKTAQK